MGMFGNRQGWADALQILGSSLKDASSGGNENLLNVQQMMGRRQLLAQQQAEEAQRQQFTQSLIGRLGPQYADAPGPQVSAPQGQSVPGMFGAAGRAAVAGAAPAPYEPPQRTGGGLDINSPDLAPLLLGAPKGFDPSTLLKVLTAQQPDVRFDRGFGYNGKTGAAVGGFHPDLDKGQGYENGRVSNLPGAVDAASEMAGGVEGAKARAGAPYQFQKFQGPDGSDSVVSTATAAALGARGGLIAKGQSPADASAAKIIGDARAGAQVTLPADLNGVATAIETAKTMMNHPALDKRTGGWSMLPAIPGTAGAEFEAYKKQVLGQGWMDARQALKGGGPITDYEGKKAEQAKMRMDAAQTPAAFKKATQDYVASLERARVLMEQRAGAAPSQGAKSTVSAKSFSAADRVAEARRRGLIK